MKPLNLDNRPCSPISSNCVIWQGPDIPCIKLCTGDTVSDVIFSLATELCTIMDQLKVSNYDLTCLGISACPPEDFQALIQLLIDKICELNGITPDEGKSSGCPDCVVAVAECFIEGNVTNMQLIDYVQMIANRVCSILSEIDLINNSITNLVNITNDLQNQIDNLPVYELPKITLTCAIGPYGIGTQVSLDTLVGTFLNTVWCPFYAATGTTTELLAAVAQKCILDGTLQLSTGTPYGTNPNWIADVNYNTVADAINNIWVVLCDIFNYVDNLNVTLSVQDTPTINLDYTSSILTAVIQDTGWVDLLGFEFYDTGIAKPQCRRIGNVVYFRGSAVIPIASGGGTPLTYNNSAGANTYITSTVVTPAQSGTGCVEVDNSAGSIYWNNKTSVIPSSVVSPTASSGFYFDNQYSKALTLGSRVIVLEENVELNPDLISGFLSTVGTLFITKEGYLAIATVRDGEETNVSAYKSNYSYNTSHLNYIISHVVQDQFVPNYQALETTVHSTPTSGLLAPASVQPINMDFRQSSTWTIGRNTPTSAKNFKYPFSFNGNDVNSLGGVAFSLDGFTAFIDVCTDDIKNKICPK